MVEHHLWSFLELKLSDQRQSFPSGDSPPYFGPTMKLDFELEMTNNKMTPQHNHTSKLAKRGLKTSTITLPCTSYKYHTIFTFLTQHQNQEANQQLNCLSTSSLCSQVISKASLHQFLKFDQMAAASATMQSIFLSAPAAGLLSARSASPRLAGFIPKLSKHARRNGNKAPKCTLQQGGDVPKEAMSDPTAQPSVTPSKVKTTSITDLLEFSSPAPERINGRLAMLGFVSAIGAELISGQDVFSQISHGGFQLFLGASILFSIASFIPFFKGVDVESKSEGLMNSDAELLNGRLAMLGLVALAVSEFAKGSALV